MKRLQALDVIRGLAILLVLILHYVPRTAVVPELYLQLTSLFWSGVDLFFVLSGFLIATILLDNKEAINYYSTFYVRRSARILPLYFGLILFFMVVLYFNPETFANTLINHFPIWSYFTFTQNFFAAAGATFGGKWMGVTWSLAVEEQFYIFLSLAVKTLRKKVLTYLAFALILIAPILRYTAPNDIYAYVMPVHRADSLMVGVLLALVWRSHAGKKFILSHINVFRITFWALFARILFLSFEDINYGDPLGHTWLAFFYVNLVLLGLTSNPQGRGLFNSKLLAWVGLRSYGIYLLHRPLMILVRYVFVRFSLPRLDFWTELLVITLVTLAAAEISYQLLEKPFMALGHKLKYKYTKREPITLAEA